MSTAERYPLSWPVGWTRTLRHQRQRASFRASSHRTEQMSDGRVSTYRTPRALTVADAIKRLSGELDRLGARNALVSSNVELRLDGLPRSGQSEPNDPGAAVYFKLREQDRCLACDKWNRVADNIAAIAQHIDALRRIDRYGVGTLEQAFAGYTAIPQKTGGADWRSEMGFAEGFVSAAQIEERFRLLARQRHPDSGGSHEAMARLNVARDAALEDLGVAALS